MRTAIVVVLLAVAGYWLAKAIILDRACRRYPFSK